MFQLIQQIDTAIIEFMQNYIHNGFLDKLMPIITNLGQGGIIWIIVIVVLLLNKKYRHVGLMTLCAVLLSTVTVEFIIKPLVQRPRPFETFNLHLLISQPDSYSFPSGHSAVAFAASCILFKQLKKYGYLFIILASLIAFSRAYLFVHYTSDVLAGIIIGILYATIVLTVYGRFKAYQKTNKVKL